MVSAVDRAGPCRVFYNELIDHSPGQDGLIDHHLKGGEALIRTEGLGSRRLPVNGPKLHADGWAVDTLFAPRQGDSGLIAKQIGRAHV